MSLNGPPRLAYPDSALTRPRAWRRARLGATLPGLPVLGEDVPLEGEPRAARAIGEEVQPGGGPDPGDRVEPVIEPDHPLDCLRLFRSGGWVLNGSATAGFAAVECLVLRFMKRNHIPNASFGVLNGDGKLILARGYTNPHAVPRGDPLVEATPCTRFRVASISKPITAIATLHLKQRAAPYLLERKVHSIVPFPLGLKKPAEMNSITVEHLLSHLSGWDDDVFHPCRSDVTIAEFYGRSLPVTRREIINYTLTQKDLNSIPGDTHSYSNFNYMLLSQIIENMSGVPYEEYVESNILHPVRALRTVRGLTRLRDRRVGEVRYYSASDDLPSVCSPSGPPWDTVPLDLQYRPNQFVRWVLSSDRRLLGRRCVYAPYGRFNLNNYWGAAAWLSCAPDLLRIAREVTVNRNLRLNLLSEASLYDMFTPRDRGYGLGWRIGRFFPGSRSHTGHLNGTRALLFLFPDQYVLGQPGAGGGPGNPGPINPYNPLQGREHLEAAGFALVFNKDQHEGLDGFRDFAGGALLDALIDLPRTVWQRAPNLFHAFCQGN